MVEKLPTRIINVTHTIPYTIRRTAPLSKEPPSYETIDEHATATATTSSAPLTQSSVTAFSSKFHCTRSQTEEDVDATAAAPISNIARKRHHQRSGTVRRKITAGNWSIVESRGHGALYAGLASLRQPHQETIHIGWTGPILYNNKKLDVSQLRDEDTVDLKSSLQQTSAIVPVFLDNHSTGHYEGYCKEVLWPLLHYIVWSNATDGRKEKQYWADYVAVNQQFADAVIAQHREGDTICIHDYHLMLVPQMIRKELPNATIGIFIHATFPSSEIFRCLSARAQILEGMLGADLVGFQTYSYARHFISSCTRVLGHESTLVGINANGRQVSVTACPIGIDVGRVKLYLQEKAVQPKMDAIRAMYAGKKIIVGRDKLDSTKGVLQKLRAYETFLHDYPEWRNKVVLIQVTTPTASGTKTLETKVSEVVSHINGLYGSLEFSPVHHYHQDIDRAEYYALLSVADIGLITSVRDGMNTTAFEFVVCQQESKQKSPLILSEFTGTAGSLSATLLVNPWDSSGVARAINEALTMPEEDRLARHKTLFEHVEHQSASFWAHAFVKQLRSAEERKDKQDHETPPLDIPHITDAFKKAKKRLLLFDYDGTLTPIVSQPQDAKPSEELIEYLQRLCDNPKNQVWVISGRDQNTLDEWLGSRITNIGLSAEHGCFLKAAGAPEWTDILDQADMSWKGEVAKIFEYYTERTQGSFVEHKRSSITWHYRLADKDYGAFQANECQNHLENAIVSKLPVEVLKGKRNLEVRPAAINKGEIVKRIMYQHDDASFLLCAGDDKTDEDMFRVLDTIDQQADSPTVFSVTVGPPEKTTMAKYHLASSHAIVNLLKELS